jgi:Flp pilus assembly protein TadB
MEPRAVVAERDRIARDLPVAAHLLSSALVAGAAPVAAIELVGGAIGGPLASHLRRVAAIVRLGGDLGATWRSVRSDDGLAPLGRTVARALETGAPLADALDRLAVDLRSRQRFEVDRRARSVGVRAAAPLGLCFLPAFLLVGVVPVVIGIATTIFGTLG